MNIKNRFLIESIIWRFNEESYKVPSDVKKAAKQGLELRKKFGRGGLSNKQASKEKVGSGVQRASDLISGSVSEKTIRRMVAFFSRHEKNKDTPPEKGNGKIAWLLWGGDPGKRWAEKTLKEIEKEENA